MADCPICVEPFNGSTRKECLCHYCGVKYCRECVGSWLTGLVDEPRCPNDTCKKLWSREYLDSVMTKVWRDSTYREYREKLLMDRERALLPATQPRIEAMNEAKRIEKEIIVPMTERKKELHAQMRALQMEDQGIQTQIWDLRNQAERLRQGIGVDEAAAKQKNVFVRRCPANGCRGFLSTAWKCGVCELYSCSECHEVKGVGRDSEHTCDAANVETAKLLAKDSKPCPKCGEVITKIDGCDQMWCVSCHTAFSWKSGQIATGVVHNPHYYEWQRKMNNGDAPRNPGDIPCGGIIDWSTIKRAIGPADKSYPAWLQILEMAHRRINHVQDIDLQALNREGINVLDNIDLRIEYLLKNIDDDSMMSMLIAREKKKEKDRELRRIYETLVGAASDVFRRAIQIADEKGKDESNFKPLLYELNELRKFINDALDTLRRRYNCTLHGFNTSWDRLSLKKKRGDDAAEPTEIKTPYGLFNDALIAFETYFATIKPPTPGQTGAVVLRDWWVATQKLDKLVETFPRLSSDTQKIARQVVAFYQHSVRAIMYTNDRGTGDYYIRMRDRNKDAPEEWKKHVLTIQLVDKPINEMI